MPRKHAVELLEAGGGPLSSGERIVLLTAFSVWNGAGDAKIGNTVHRLDNKNLAAIGSLMVAVAGGMHAVDRWILDMEGRLGLDEDLADRRVRRGRS